MPALRLTHLKALLAVATLLLLAQLPFLYMGLNPANSVDTLVTTADTLATSLVPEEEGVVLTRDLCVLGHEVPHPELCPAQGKGLRLLILVTSAPEHAEAREAVRSTWGYFAKRTDVALGFMLGEPPLALLRLLRAEDARYGDLVMGRFEDSYSNLTLKTLSILEWADTYCPLAQRLLKTDDDIFVNVPSLLNFMAARANATWTIWGNLHYNATVTRNPKSKSYLSSLQFPEQKLPTFASGAAYLMTMDVVGPMLRAAPYLPYVRLEDVFVTGVLAERLGVRREHVPNYYKTIMELQRCDLQRYVAIHMSGYQNQFYLMRRLIEGVNVCKYNTTASHKKRLRRYP